MHEEHRKHLRSRHNAAELRMIAQLHIVIRCRRGSAGQLIGNVMEVLDDGNFCRGISGCDPGIVTFVFCKNHTGRKFGRIFPTKVERMCSAHFKTLSAMREATVEEIAKVKGIGIRDAEKVFEYLKNN